MYTFRLSDGLEFGLAGIERWVFVDGRYEFFDDSGLCLVVSEEHLVCFRPSIEALPNVNPVEQEVDRAQLPEENRRAAQMEGEREGQRFNLMPTADHGHLIVDTETDQTCPGHAGMLPLINLANEADHRRKLEAEVKSLEPTLSIHIKDVDLEPIEQMKRKRFDEEQARGSIQLVMTPVARRGGDQFRIEMDDETVYMRRCTIHTIPDSTETQGKVNRESVEDPAR